jgi:hypothetical protein
LVMKTSVTDDLLGSEGRCELEDFAEEDLRE